MEKTEEVQDFLKNFGIEDRWTFHDRITVGFLSDLDMSLSELKNLGAIMQEGKLKPKLMLKIANGLIKTGPTLTRESSYEELMYVFGKAIIFLVKGLKSSKEREKNR